ncbi:MAG: response regulator [Kangiellaceae bacterium]|nr:response regulator [Kangiellaceae bacterium]
MIFNLAKKTTLIVEDFAEFARSVRAMLHQMGATQVDIVNNAEDAIVYCKNKKYDIILSDYNLGPKKDGQQLLEELHKYKLIKSNCVFLMLTAENTAAMVMGAVEFIPDSYIAKPFNGNLLKARLQKSIERRDVLSKINRAMRNKQWETVLEEVKSVQENHPKYKMACFRSKVKALKNLRRLDEALEIATELVSIRSIPWALEAIGEIYFLKKDYERAIDIFKNQIKEFPMAIDAYDWLARIQHLTGQPIEAQETITNAINRSPKALHRQKRLGELAEENNDILVMTKAYRNAIKYGQNSAFASPDEYIKLTAAISKQAQSDPKTITDKLITEVEQTFKQLDKKFSTSIGHNFRNQVAKASYLSSFGKQEESNRSIERAKVLYREVDEEIPARVSLEVSQTLIELEDTEFADSIIADALQQNADDPEFVKKASKICSNQELLKHCQQASKINQLAVAHFNKNRFADAISEFEKAYSMTPKNINITLNYVQTLMKQAQKESNSSKLVNKAERLLGGITQLGINDARATRYNELKRLNQLMLQKL